MPFTPFHLGPGLLFKAVGGSRFSFMIFGGSQVLMDIEPLVKILRAEPNLHGVSHTMLGALVIGLASGVVGRPISAFALRLLRVRHAPITWPVAFLSGFVGTYSHIALDAFMHKDMVPLWPLMAGNDVLGAISLGWLHIVCVLSGVVGLTVILTKGETPPS